MPTAEPAICRRPRYSPGCVSWSRDGRPLDGLAIVAYLVRPSNEGLDTTITPRALGDGRYGASFELPATGQWELRLVAQVDEVTWQHSERLFVK